MATPHAYRLLALRLVPYRRPIFTLGVAYLILWLGYAFLSMLTQTSLPWYIHNTVFIYAAWILPIVGWFFGLFGFFGPNRGLLTRSHPNPLINGLLVAASWYVAFLLGAYALVLLIGPLLLWAPAILARLGILPAA